MTTPATMPPEPARQTPGRPDSSPAQPGQSPFGAVLALTFVNSLGTGVVTNGIFFLTDGPTYAFSRTRNYLLGIALGLTYIAAAVGAGRVLSVLRRRFPSLTSRSVLVLLMVGMALLCALPQAAVWSAPAGSKPSAWPIWTLVCLYSPLTGVLWPLVESYVSGGRSGERLRSAVGTWNVVWSSAIVVTYWGISPLVKSHAIVAIFSLGAFHLFAAPFILRCTKDPAPHLPEHHDPHPPVYTKLLVTFRLLLPMSYIVSSALGPYLPGAMARLGVAENWRVFLATAWLVPRVITFFLLQRWQGWHGRWSLAIIGGGLLVVGFGISVLAPVLTTGNAAVAVLLGGLFMFGTGMATIYSAALYYAMEVGKSEVDAGGAHEALIGFGYTIGPGIGLIASLAVERHWVAPDAFEPVVLGTVALLAVGVATAVARRVHRHTR